MANIFISKKKNHVELTFYPKLEEDKLNSFLEYLKGHKDLSLVNALAFKVEIIFTKDIKVDDLKSFCYDYFKNYNIFKK